MKTFISILRGINVSGHNLIKMDDLRKMYGSLKFRNIETYIQSGNVIFQSEADSRELEKKISGKLLQDFSIQVPVLVMELNELNKVAQNNPFMNKRKEDIKTLHVTFLSDPPKKEDLSVIQKNQYAPDEFMASGKILYLFCPGGYGNTRLSNTFFEKKLKVIATTRNWKTVLQLMNIAKRIDDAA